MKSEAEREQLSDELKTSSHKILADQICRVPFQLNFSQSEQFLRCCSCQLEHILLPYLENLLIYRAQFSKKDSPLIKVCQLEADPNLKDLSFIPIWLAASQISEPKMMQQPKKKERKNTINQSLSARGRSKLKNLSFIPIWLAASQISEPCHEQCESKRSYR